MHICQNGSTNPGVHSRVKKKSKGQRATEETLQSGCMGKRFMECVDEGDLTGHHIRGEVYTI